ncbi:MAG TPA: PKD domain-containing protein, partial [Thermoanaerobaculia bacterium]|nr:PKD domain-containing protein [Thermoanaerobaculia bacterium]
MDPKSPATVFAATNGAGIFKSTDGAASWASVGGHPTTTFVSLAIDPVTPSTLYGGTGGGVLKSTNGGANFAGAGNLSGSAEFLINAMAIDPVTPSTVYAGLPTGIFRSTNGGGSWKVANAGLSALKILALAADPARPATIYAGADAGLFKSVDGGTTWTHLFVGANVTRVFSLAVLPGSSTILAGTDLGAWKSTDGGATWTLTLQIISYAFAVDPTSPSTVYAVGGAGPSGPTEGVACKSADAGSTWTIPFGGSPAPLPVFESVLVTPTSPPTVIVGTDKGVYGIFVHPSGGLEWVTNGALGSRIVFALAVDPASTSTIWAGTDKGLFKSTDAGLSWKQVTNGLTATGIYVLRFDPASPTTFYAGTDGGLFRSTDRGANWTALNGGLTNLVVNAFAIAAGSPRTLYAGIFGGSVFRFPTAPPVADFTWGGVPVAGQPVGFADLTTGPLTSWSWTFGDGGVSTTPYPTYTYATAGSFPVSLTVTNAAGSSTKARTVTVSPAIAGATAAKVVPVVLDVSGVGGARFGSELTLANRGTTTSTVVLTYVPATSLGASGGGSVVETLDPGRQLVFPDAMAYLRGKGLAIPTGSNQGGALFVRFEGLSSADVAFAGARTTAPSGSGRAGLAYSGVRLEDGFTAKVYVFGLRENAADRSNLALV